MDENKESAIIYAKHKKDNGKSRNLLVFEMSQFEHLEEISGQELEVFPQNPSRCTHVGSDRRAAG